MLNPSVHQTGHHPHNPAVTRARMPILLRQHLKLVDLGERVFHHDPVLAQHPVEGFVFRGQGMVAPRLLDLIEPMLRIIPGQTVVAAIGHGRFGVWVQATDQSMLACQREVVVRSPRHTGRDRTDLARRTHAKLILEGVALVLARIVGFLGVLEGTLVIPLGLGTPDPLLLGIDNQGHLRKGVHDRFP